MRPQGPNLNSSASLPAVSWRVRVPFYYGWAVVASTFLALTVTYGVYYSFSVFFVSMLEQFGWGRGATAGVFSVHVLVIGLTGVVSGRLIDRFGPSRVVPVGGLFLAVGLLATSRLDQLWQFYLFYGVICAFGISLAGWVPCVVVVSRWFTTKRGLAIGIASAGIGLGTVMMVPLNQWLISTMGWRSAYLALAVVALVGIAPQAALLQVGSPEQIGMKPDGGGGDEAARKRAAARQIVVDEKWASRQWTLSMALRTSRFWFLLAMILTSVLTNQMLWVHQVAYLVDGGYDKMMAAAVTGMAGLISMGTKIVWGGVADRLGREVTFSLGIGFMVVAIGILVLAGMVPGVWLGFLFALVFAIGYGVNAPVTPSAAADIFAGRDFGSIYGVLNLGMGLGGAFGSWFAGYLFDATGSYLAAFALAACCSLAGGACMWLAAPRKVRRAQR